ncbi:hypothetical protein, partial [Mesorhizobium amorphae]|uniref:hypothetical protein n=1 Tax=Mesorhizobium amorphae TaxID=71433 RepID=UPI001AEC6BD2
TLRTESVVEARKIGCGHRHSPVLWWSGTLLEKQKPYRIRKLCDSNRLRLGVHFYVHDEQKFVGFPTRRRLDQKAPGILWLECEENAIILTRSVRNVV